MRLLHDNSWTRRGFTLLWNGDALTSIAKPEEVISLRSLFAFGSNWPDDLPGGRNALVVAGLEASLDAIGSDDVEPWLDRNVRERLLSFQESYQGGASLVFWLPSGRKRINMSPADESYHWRPTSPGHPEIPLGRLLFSGAETDLVRLINPASKNQDPDGEAWLGLHLPRLS
jgi:hypothetical protein